MSKVLLWFLFPVLTLLGYVAWICMTPFVLDNMIYDVIGHWSRMVVRFGYPLWLFCATLFWLLICVVAVPVLLVQTIRGEM